MTITRDQAIHEAGHAVVADALGFHVFVIEDHETGPQCGVWLSEEPSAHERYLTAAWSLGGGAATLRDGGTPGPEACVDLDGAWSSAEAFLVAEGAAYDSDDIDATVRRAAWLAQSIVNDRWQAVLALAAHVEANDGATEEDIARILARYRGAGGALDSEGVMRPTEEP